MSLLNKYSSIVPDSMTRRELGHLIIELTTARNWNLKSASVDVATGIDKDGYTTYTEYKVDLDRLQDYQNAHKTVML
jgi:hypothetical protein